jgi:myb proto-oncogene protein
MIKQVGHNWRLIAEELGTKSGKQIRERFINKLDPNIRREEWTEEEDMKIIELYSQMGSKWCEISKCLSGRP